MGIMELLVTVAMFALAAGMAAAAIRTYTGQGVCPAIYPENARTDSKRFRPGTYTAGTCVGQITTLTAANDVQTITFTGTPTGGTFRLSFNGQVTSAITYSVTDATVAANVLAALEALSNIGEDNVTVSFASSGTVGTITFVGDLGASFQPDLVFYTNDLTGGSDPAATFAHTTPGRALGGQWGAYDDSLSNGLNIMKGVLQYDLVVDTFGYHTVGGGEWGSRELSAPIWIKGHFFTSQLTGIDANGVADCGRIVEGSTLSDAGTIMVIE